MMRAAGVQRGMMLLEALIGILIFSVGVLAVVGLQAMSIKSVADAKYRADAALLVNELIGDIWITSKNLATMQSLYDSRQNGTYYQTWAGNVQSQMPGINLSATPQVNAPTVHVDPVSPSGLPAITVTVTVNWKLPGEAAHSYSTVTQLNCTVTDTAGTACSW